MKRDSEERTGEKKTDMVTSPLPGFDSTVRGGDTQAISHLTLTGNCLLISSIFITWLIIIKREELNCKPPRSHKKGHSESELKNLETSRGRPQEIMQSDFHSFALELSRLHSSYYQPFLCKTRNLLFSFKSKVRFSQNSGASRLHRKHQMSHGSPLHRENWQW